jgi:DNA-binding NarL/FixJ family response regulator
MYVLILDQQPFYKEGLSNFVKQLLPDVKISHFEELSALKSLTRDLDDSLLVVDPWSAEKPEEILKFISKVSHKTKVIVLTNYSNEAEVLKAVETGIRSLVFKHESQREIEKAIMAVRDGDYYFNRELSKKIHEHIILGKKTAPEHETIELTKRELEILRLICEQKTNREIADQLSVSARTIDNHRNNMLHKAGARNTVGLVLYAVHKGIYKA